MYLSFYIYIFWNFSLRVFLNYVNKYSSRSVYFEKDYLHNNVFRWKWSLWPHITGFTDLLMGPAETQRPLTSNDICKCLYADAICHFNILLLSHQYYYIFH